MSDQPFVLAVPLSPDDASFASIEALGRHIDALRCALDGAPDLVGVVARLARDSLPGGKVVTVRADAGEGLRGVLIGYAFVPGFHPADRLMAAVDQAAAARRLRPLTQALKEAAA